MSRNYTTWILFLGLLFPLGLTAHPEVKTIEVMISDGSYALRCEDVSGREFVFEGERRGYHMVGTVLQIEQCQLDLDSGQPAEVFFSFGQSNHQGYARQGLESEIYRFEYDSPLRSQRARGRSGYYRLREISEKNEDRVKTLSDWQRYDRQRQQTLENRRFGE